MSSYSSHKGQASSRQKKRHREDIEVRTRVPHLLWGRGISGRAGTEGADTVGGAWDQAGSGPGGPWGTDSYGWAHLQDYTSLFPVDDVQPSKLMRLLSSNDEDPNLLSSPSE